MTGRTHHDRRHPDRGRDRAGHLRAGFEPSRAFRIGRTGGTADRRIPARAGAGSAVSLNLRRNGSAMQRDASHRTRPADPASSLQLVFPAFEGPPRDERSARHGSEGLFLRDDRRFPGRPRDDGDRLGRRPDGLLSDGDWQPARLPWRRSSRAAGFLPRRLRVRGPGRSRHRRARSQLPVAGRPAGSGRRITAGAVHRSQSTVKRTGIPPACGIGPDSPSPCEADRRFETAGVGTPPAASAGLPRLGRPLERVRASGRSRPSVGSLGSILPRRCGLHSIFGRKGAGPQPARRCPSGRLPPGHDQGQIVAGIHR